jgi:hypothetical protein
VTAEGDAGTRNQAAQRGLELIAAPPWAELERELTLLLVRPPRDEWADDPALLEMTPAFWLLLDGADARTLPEPWREPLVRDSLRRVRDPATELTVLTLEGCAALLEASNRRALEARWTVRHAEAIHDPLARYDSLGRAAGRLPVDALERVMRPLYLQAFAALDALPHARAGALVAAGEAAGATGRLACLLEEGSYPPLEWLALATRETRLGRRLRPWLDGLAVVAAGDEAALERAASAAPDVLQEIEAALRPHFADRGWLQDPERFALRPPRG